MSYFFPVKKELSEVVPDPNSSSSLATNVVHAYTSAYSYEFNCDEGFGICYLQKQETPASGSKVALSIVETGEWQMRIVFLSTVPHLEDFLKLRWGKELQEELSHELGYSRIIVIPGYYPVLNGPLPGQHHVFVNFINPDETK